MKLTIKIPKKLDQLLKNGFDVNNSLQKALIDISLLIQTTAKEPSYAPYKTWNLRRSITTDWSNITRLKAIVWSPVIYARIQEIWWTIYPKKAKYLTFQIDWKRIRTKSVTIKWKYYLKRAYQDNSSKINGIVLKALDSNIKQ